eukprot:TRINITY_DN10217_c0_g1_i1.p1 TRINITY_DN10217_c0_g1~~TRINITY_DN10217_c0_g1_i1.p1  ORF type:complete len:302 (+),score=61.76 TRINITY_DN10217_c0_g1_i1:146-1051(+)
MSYGGMPAGMYSGHYGAGGYGMGGGYAAPPPPPPASYYPPGPSLGPYAPPSYSTAPPASMYPGAPSAPSSVYPSYTAPPTSMYPGASAPPASMYPGAPSAAPTSMYPQQAPAAAPATQANQPSFWYTRVFSEISQQELGQLQNWFQSVDIDRAGKISAIPLTTLQFGGRNLDVNTAQKAIRIFDRDGTRLLSFQDFACLYKFLGCVAISFQKQDVNRTGALDVNSVARAVGEMNLGVSFPNIQAYHKKFAGDISKPLTSAQYMNMVIELALIKSRMELYDPLRQGKCQFTLDALAQLSTEI